MANDIQANNAVVEVAYTSPSSPNLETFAILAEVAYTSPSSPNLETFAILAEVAYTPNFTNAEVSLLTTEYLYNTSNSNAEVSQLTTEFLYNSTQEATNAEVQQVFVEFLYERNLTNVEVSLITTEVASTANSNAEVLFISTEVASTANSDASVEQFFIEVASENVANESFLYATLSSNNSFYSSVELGDVATQIVSEMYVEVLSNASARRVYIPGSGWWRYTGNTWIWVGWTWGTGYGSGNYTGGGYWMLINGVWVWVDAYGNIAYFASLPQQITNLNVEVLSSNTLITAEQQNFLYM